MCVCECVCVDGPLYFCHLLLLLRVVLELACASTRSGACLRGFRMRERLSLFAVADAGETTDVTHARFRSLRPAGKQHAPHGPRAAKRARAHAWPLCMRY